MVYGKLAAQRECHQQRDYDPTIVESDRDTKDATELDMGFHVSPLRDNKHKKSKCVLRNACAERAFLRDLDLTLQQLSKHVRQDTSMPIIFDFHRCLDS